jgi:hypothetical protein
LIRDPLHYRRLIANALLASAVLACACLLFYPPTQSSVYPACPIHALFGIDCPGCGATRALAALLRGHLREALHFNALFVLLLPVALPGAIATYRRAIRPGPFRWPTPPMPAIYATVAVTTIFTVARNLPR